MGISRGIDHVWYRKIMETHHGKCAECGGEDNLELHHRLANTKQNRALYPLFIDSVFNLVPLCGTIANGCHVSAKHKYQISMREAKLYESYLQELVSNYQA